MAHAVPSDRLATENASVGSAGHILGVVSQAFATARSVAIAIKLGKARINERMRPVGG